MLFGKYNILDTFDKLEAFDNYFMDGDSPRFELVSYDTETNGLHFKKRVVIGFSISVNRHAGFYIPLLTWIPDESSFKTRTIKGEKVEFFEKGHFLCVWTGQVYPEDVSPDQYQAPDFIKQKIERWLAHPDVKLVMHNAPFDILMTEGTCGVDLTDNLFIDTVLLKHIIDENSPNGLKEIAKKYQVQLGIDASEEANKEQLEMSASVIRNGGIYNTRTKHVWRCVLEIMGKYACADTFLTYGIAEVLLEIFSSEYEEKHFDWFFEDEVMPLCKEVVIPMKRHGVAINVQHFKEMEEETVEKLNEIEDEIIQTLEPYLRDFEMGKGLDEIVSKNKLIEEIIEMEGLAYPTVLDKKTGVSKKSIAKAVVKKVNETNPHWVWSYLLGQDEIRYSEKKLKEVRDRIYVREIGRRYRFNIQSNDHLRWLFCDKLGYQRAALPQTNSATKKNPIPSMKAKVLREFFLEKHPDFVKPLLLYKKMFKLLSTYIRPALALHHNGYLHMDMVQSGTVSGRFACRGGFNLQTLPQVEEIDKCNKCGSKNVMVFHPIRLLAVMGCNSCEHIEEDVLCPSAIKEGFIAPQNAKIVNADYSSLEPRCFSFVSGDSKLKEVYWNDLDLYSKVYCDMLDKAGEYSPDPKSPKYLKKQNKKARDMVKVITLGIPYGSRAPQVANLMNLKKTKRFWNKQKSCYETIEVLDVEKGAFYRDLYLDTYPNLRTYMANMESQAMKKGYVETLVGRRRHFKYTKPVAKLLKKAGIKPDEFLDMKKKELQKSHINSVMTKEALYKLAEECGFKVFDEKKKVYRDWAFVRAMFKNELNNSKNFPIQGLAAHITNLGMLKFTREAKERKLKSYVALQVHDEITTISFETDSSVVVETLRKSMEKNKFTEMLDIPMIAEPIIANTLKDAK